MGDELFLRSRCSGGAGCHCAGMEHFYVPDSTDRAPPVAGSSRGRRVSGRGGEMLNDSVHSATSSVLRPALARSGSTTVTQDCTAALLASVFDTIGETSAPAATADTHRVRSRRVKQRSGRGHTPSERRRESAEDVQADTSGLPDLSYLAYSSDDEFEEFMKKPRTDYTYARSLSYTAVRPQEVGPPSMSRLGLHAAGDSPLSAAARLGVRPGAEGVPTAGRPSTADGVLLTGGHGQAAVSPVLAGGGEQGVYESTTTRVYSYRREITSRVSSMTSLLSNVSVAAPRSFTYTSSAAGEAPSRPSSPPASGSAPRAVRAPPLASSPLCPSASNSAASSTCPTPLSEDTLRELELSGGDLHSITAGLDADSQDEEWLPADGRASKLDSQRCSTPYGKRAGWSVVSAVCLALWPLLRLWLLLLSACRRIWAAARPLLLVRASRGRSMVREERTEDTSAVSSSAGRATAAAARASAGGSTATSTPASTAAAAAEGRGSRPPSQARHRYSLRPRLTPQRDATPAEWQRSAGGADGQSAASAAAAGSASAWWNGSTREAGSDVRPAATEVDLGIRAGPGRLVTALAWLAAVLWFINPLRWASVAASAAISRARTAAEVLNLPRGGATVGSSGKRTERPGWLSSAAAMLWGSTGSAAAAAAGVPSAGRPGSGTRAELWQRSGSIFDRHGSSVGAGDHAGTGSSAGAGSHATTTNGGGSSALGDQWSGGSATLDGRQRGGQRRRCLPVLAAALLLLLLTLLLLPIMGWLGGDGGESPGGEVSLLPAGKWSLPDMTVLKLHLAEGLSSLADGVAGGMSSLADGLAGGLSYLTGGLSWLVGAILTALASLAMGLLSLLVYTLALIQVTVTQLYSVAGSAALALWAPLASETVKPPLPLPPVAVIDSNSAAAPAASASAAAAAAGAGAQTAGSAPADATVDTGADVPVSPDPRLAGVLLQLDELKARIELLQSQYQSCRAAAEEPPSPSAVRAALGLPPDSSAPTTAESLAAAELRLRRQLDAELAAVRALLGKGRTDVLADAEAGGGAALAERLARLEAALAASHQRRSDSSDTHAARLDSLEAETARLRTELSQLHRALSAAEHGLQRAGACCNRTGAEDWSGRLGAELGRLRSQLEDRVQLYADAVRKDLTSEMSSLTATAAAGAPGAPGGGGGGVSREEAAAIARDELALYDADKTGQFDYALESAGGSVLGTRCTEPYSAHSPRLTVLGVPLWYPVNNPRSIIQPHSKPGECFAFHGEGQFVIGLSRPVRPTEFVIEHIAKGLTPGGRIDSAPRHCTVLAVEDSGEPSSTLASFEYSASGTPLQRFPVTPAARAVSAVELRVSSNWGHPEYTCLYRFRVHGEPETERERGGDGGGM